MCERGQRMKQSAKGKKWKPTMFIQQPDYMIGNVNVQNEYRFFIDFYHDRGGGEHIMDKKKGLKQKRQMRKKIMMVK